MFKLKLIFIAVIILPILKSHSFSAEILNGRADYYTGFDVSGSNIFGYGGFSIAPQGKLDEPGIRFKLSGGAGRYQYDGETTIGSTSLPVTFTGHVTSIDMMLGYYFRTNDWITKAYLGIRYSDHNISPEDTGNAVQGGEVGIAGQVEIWKDINEKSWFSSDLSYSSGFNEYWGQVRVGYKVFQKIDMGVEGALSGSDNYSAGRIGALGKIQTEFGEISLSGGVGGNYGNDNVSPYFSMSLYKRF